MPTPYIPFILAGLSLGVAMWLSVRRPPATMAAPCVRWHATRATLTTLSATLAAVLVLLGLSRVL